MRDGRKGHGKLVRGEGACVCVLEGMKLPGLDEKGGQAKGVGQVSVCGRGGKAMQIELEKWRIEKEGRIDEGQQK